MSIKGKILFWFLLPTILIGTVTVGISYYYIHKTVKQDIFDQLALASNALHERVHAFLQEKRRLVFFSSTDSFIKDCTEEITKRDDGVRYYTERLNTHLAINRQPVDPDILEVFIVDLDGNAISSTEINRIGKNVSSEPYFSETMKRGSSISDLHYSAEFNQNTFELARLITDKDPPEILGIIVNRYRGDSLRRVTRSGISEEFQELMQQEGLGETGELYIVDSDKLMITESRFIKDVILKQVVDTEGVKTAFDSGVGMICIYPDYRGVPVLGVSRYFEEMDWVILAEKDVSEAFAPVARLRNFSIAIGVAGIIVIVTVAVFLSTGITRPINKLVETTRVIADGDLTKHVNVKSKDEIGLLGQSFNKMADSLLESYNDMELNVKKRTAELQEANANVVDRSNRLEEKVRKLNKSRRATLYMIEDLNKTSNELKASRERVLRSERLAAIGKLAGIMGHEIRNPLGVIRTSIYFLDMVLKESMDEKVKKHLNILQTQIDSSDRIISDVLDFARMKAPDLKEEDINYVVKEALSNAAIPPIVKVHTGLAANQPKVRVDTCQVEQVFLNLITNAVQAMPEGGELKVTTCQDGKFIIITFKDTGCGISKEDLTKIFEPLFSTKAKGVGLGLATCQGHIQAHKGKIEVESEEGKGTIFRVKLPV